MKTICFLLTLACTGVRSGVQDVAACRIAVMDSSTAADSASVAVACRRAVTRYFVLTARQAPTGTVHVGAFNAFAIERAEVPWKFDWPSATSCRRIGVKLGYMQGSDSAFCANEITAVLPHELGHVFNYAGFVAGTASLPAWYDEATAMWMEPDELQMQRLSQAQQWRSSAPDIASLMSAIHPRVGTKHAAFSRTQITGPCRGTCGERRDGTVGLLL